MGLLLKHVEQGLHEHDRNAIEETLAFTENLVLEKAKDIPPETYAGLTKQIIPLFDVPHQNVCLCPALLK